jgi:hypothetical protein
MNKSATMAMAVLVLTAAGLSRLGAATSDRPSGVAPTARGYFMIKGAGGWIRAVVIDPIKGPGNTG